MMRTFLTGVCICILFITSISILTPSQDTILSFENRSKTSFPTIPEHFSQIRPELLNLYFSQIGHFMEDHFPFRSKLLISISYLHQLLKDDINPNICLRGKEDWLFLGNAHGQTISKIKGIVSLKHDEKRLNQITEKYKFLESLALKKNARFFIFIGPDKQSVYPEYLSSIILPASNRYIDPLIQSLVKENIQIYDPTDLLIHNKDKGLLYYKRDTHWNKKGSFIAANDFLKFIGLEPLKSPKYIKISDYRGDLLHLGGYYNSQDFIEDRVEIQPESIISAKNRQKVWLFGDSFSESIAPIYTVAFDNFQRFQHKDYQKMMSSTTPGPDIVIYEIVERNIDSPSD